MNEKEKFSKSFQDKILNNWFLGLILLPNLVALFLNQIPMVYSILLSSLLFNILLIHAWRQDYRKFIKEKNTLTSNDIAIIQKLFRIMNVDDFEEKIYEQNSWYGYSVKVIRSSIDFVEESLKLSNQFSVDSFQEVMNNLVSKLQDFHRVASKAMYNEGDFYALPKENERLYKDSEKQSKVINKKAEEAYNSLKIVLEYLRKYKISLPNKEAKKVTL